ncbi:MAG: hypothetical protein JW976_11280 [Syntrophaceae bacterium]|nr:hypothetical protein [Syntrophaceae bacterium]
MEPLAQMLLILGAIIIVLPVLVFGFFLLRQFRLFARLLETLQLQIPLEKGEVRTQVWISNDQERSRWFKMTPSKDAGILVLTSDMVSLYSVNLKGERFTRQFNRLNLRTEWIGNQFMRDSNLQWFAIYEGESRILISSYTGMNALPSRHQTAEIYRNIAGQYAQFPGTKEFALEKNAASLSALFLIALLFVYAIADGLFINPLEVVGYSKSSLWSFVLPITIIIPFGIVFYKFMIRFSVPARETLVLAMLFCFSLQATAVPLIKRIDTAMAAKPMQTYEYRMTKEGIFEPVEKGLPKLNLRLECDYWKHFDDNHPFQFLLQKGGMGLWQFDGRALDKDINVYLKNNPKQR